MFYSLRALKVSFFFLLLLLSTFESPLIKGTAPLNGSAKPGNPSLTPNPSVSGSGSCSASQVSRPAPVVTIVSPQPPYAAIAHSTMQVMFNVNEPVSTVQYSFDDAPGVQVTGNQFRIDNLYGLGIGTHDIVIRATDSAGITGTSFPLVTHHCPGDILGRGKVDIVDVATAAFAFGSRQGDPKFDPRADMDENGVINILDIAAIAFKFGTICPSPPAISQEFQLSQIEPAQNPAIQSDGSVLLHSGEFLYRATDLVIPGRGLGYQFIRTYRSQITGSGYDGPLGDWEHNYDMRLVVEANGNINFYNGLGRVDTFVSLGGGKYQAPSGIYFMLLGTGGVYGVMPADGTIYSFNPVKTISGSQVAQLSTMRDRNNDTLTFAYDGVSRLSNVTDTLGRLVKYTYGGNGRLSQIQDFMGRTVSFYYNRNDDLIDVTGPAVTGTPNGNDFPNGKTTRYSYSSGMAAPDLNHNLLTITNPNEVANGGTAFLTNTYGTNPLDPNSFDKIVQQDLGGTGASASACGFGPAGGRLTYQYNKSQNQTTVIDRNGNVKQYMFNTLGNPLSLTEFTGGLRPTDPASYVTSFTYNPDGKLTKTVFPQGNSIVNTYDSSNPNRFSQGNLLTVTRIPDSSRGGGPTLVTTNTYEPIFNQPQNVTDPRGNTAQYLYDYQEGSPGQILALGQARGVSITNPQATGLSLGTDLNGDGITNQQHGNMIEARAPKVTLENGTIQDIRTDYWYNQYGQLVERIQPEGYADAYVYYPATDPNGDGLPGEWENGQYPPGADPRTGGYLKQVIMDNETLLRTPDFATPRVRATTTYTYDDAGNVLSVMDPRGIKSVFVVNQLNQVVRQLIANDTSHLSPNEPQPLPALRYETDYTYDSNNNLVQRAVENLDGNNTLVSGDAFIKSFYEYDILNDPTATLQSPGPTSVQPGLISNVTTIFRYDRNQNLVLEKSPVANLLTNDTSYQPNNVVSTIYDERGLVFKQSRGGIDPPFTSLPANSALLGELGAITTTPDTSTMSQSYDLNGNVATVTDGRGNATRFAYDGFDRRIFIGRSDGSVRQVTYDSNSNIIDEVALGPVGGNLPGNSTNNVRLSEIKYNYDQLNRDFRIDQSLFNTPGSPDTSVLMTHFVYDRNGRLVHLTTPAGNIRDFSYDGLGRLLDLKTPVVGSGSTSLRNEVQWQYDSNGNVVRKVKVDRSTVAPDQTFTTLYLYDAANRLIRETDNMGNTNRWSYDSRGNIVSQTDAKGPLITDPISDPTRRFPFPSTPPGISMINSDGNKVVYTYDDLGRRTMETHTLLIGGVGGNPLDTSNPFIPSGTITIRTSYDVNSRPSSSTDGNNHATGYSYDSLNRVTTTTYADGTTDQYSYDKNSNVVQHVDPNGNFIGFIYDAINRPLVVSVNRGTGVNGTTRQTFEYDGLGRVTRATDNNDPTMNDTAIVINSYDSLSRITQEQQGLSSDPRLLPVSTTYDNVSNPVTVGYPGGLTQFQYGDMHRPTVISGSNGPNPFSVSYSYIGTRLLSATYSNSVQFNATYDGDGRPTSLTYAVPGQSPVVQRNYAYDRMGNTVSEQFGDKPGMPTDYSTYNSLYQLTGYAKGETGPVIPDNTNANPDLTKFVNNKTLWTFDGAGNWPVVQVTKSNVTTTQQRLPNPMNEYQVVNGVPQGYDRNGNLIRDANNTYAYDFANRLVSVQSNTNPSNKATYLWYPMGLRAERSGSLNGRVYSLHYYYDGQDGRLVAATDQLLNPVSQFIYGPTGITLMTTASGSFYYATNGNGNVLALIDNSANVIERYDYTVYGAVAFLDRSYNPLPIQQSQVGNPALFGSQLYDLETGFYTIGDRNLDPQNGRYVQRPSVGEGPVAPSSPRLHGLIEFSNITLKRGITSDNSLWEWRNSVINGFIDEARGLSISVQQPLGLPSYCINRACQTTWQGPCITPACDNGVCHACPLADGIACADDNQMTCSFAFVDPGSGTCSQTCRPITCLSCDSCRSGVCEGAHTTLSDTPCTGGGGRGCDPTQRPSYMSPLSFSFQFSSVSTTELGHMVGLMSNDGRPIAIMTSPLGYRNILNNYFSAGIDCGPTCLGVNLPSLDFIVDSSAGEGTLDMSCGGLPPGVTCSLNPSPELGNAYAFSGNSPDAEERLPYITNFFQGYRSLGEIPEELYDYYGIRRSYTGGLYVLTETNPPPIPFAPAPSYRDFWDPGLPPLGDPH